MVIADESHYLKNMSAKRTLVIVPILKNARRVLLLTGTPAVSRPCELYAQLDAVGKPVFPDFKPFGMRYCAGHKVRLYRTSSIIYRIYFG